MLVYRISILPLSKAALMEILFDIFLRHESFLPSCLIANKHMPARHPLVAGRGRQTHEGPISRIHKIYTHICM
jgi:hypothetical protein